MHRHCIPPAPAPQYTSTANIRLGLCYTPSAARPVPSLWQQALRCAAAAGWAGSPGGGTAAAGRARRPSCSGAPCQRPRPAAGQVAAGDWPEASAACTRTAAAPLEASSCTRAPAQPAGERITYPRHADTGTWTACRSKSKIASKDKWHARSQCMPLFYWLRETGHRP